MIKAIEILVSMSPILVIYLQIRHMEKEDRSATKVNWHFGK